MLKEEFIERSRKSHGNKYSYDKVPSSFAAKDKVIITCPIHGDFEQCARTHYREVKPHGCPKCGDHHKGERLDTETFVKKYKEKFTNDLDLSKIDYKSFEEKVVVICPKHGEFKMSPHDLMRGKGCPKCGKERGGEKNRLGLDIFLRRAKEIHGDKYDYSNVKLDKFFDKVEIICPKHGTFIQTAIKHLSGQGCPKCSREKAAESRMKGTDAFIKESKSKFGDKFSYDKTHYVNCHKNVTITCPIHGDFDTTPQTHLRSDDGCPLCARETLKEKTRRSKDYFVGKAREVHGDLYTYDHFEYVNWHTPSYVTCKRHGDFLVAPVNHVGNGSGCPKCVSPISKWETEVYDFIESLGVDVERSNRSILKGTEIDMLIPRYRIGIECDGLYWHNEKYRDKNYHLWKTNECLRNGYRLIHIFEDEWKFKSEIWKSMISNLLHKTNVKIYARKCEVRLVDNVEKRKFLNDNHIQGDAVSQINLGLYCNDELVSLMTFGKPRVNLGGTKEEGKYELVRFCNKLNTIVVGGASKLFSHFLAQYSPNKVISYSDKRWSIGRLYETLGFERSHDSAPNYFYVKGMKRINRFVFRKNKLIEEGFDPSKSEREIMLERGIYRIYDCGTMVWVYKKHGEIARSRK